MATGTGSSTGFVTWQESAENILTPFVQSKNQHAPLTNTRCGMSPKIEKTDQQEKFLEILQVSWWSTKTGGYPYPVTIISFDGRWEVLNCIGAMEVNTFAKVSCPRNSEWFGNGERKANLFLGKALDVSCIAIFCQLKRLIRISVHWRDLGRYTAYIILLYQLTHLITITSIPTSYLLNHFKTSSWSTCHPSYFSVRPESLWCSRVAPPLRHHFAPSASEWIE